MVARYEHFTLQSVKIRHISVCKDKKSDFKDRIIPHSLLYDGRSEFHRGPLTLHYCERPTVTIIDKDVRTIPLFSELEAHLTHHQMLGDLEHIAELPDKPLPHPFFGCGSDINLAKRIVAEIHRHQTNRACSVNLPRAQYSLYKAS